VVGIFGTRIIWDVIIVAIENVSWNNIQCVNRIKKVKQSRYPQEILLVLTSVRG
jgi:hypothetical protein